jgi:type I restriction enzyme R subunit
MSDLPTEYTLVELPLIEQLKRMGWQHLQGDVDVPYLTERGSFRDLLLLGRLREAVRRINLDADGRPWLDEARINEAVSTLERLGAAKLMEANQVATDLLLRGTTVAGDPTRHGGREQTVRFIDFDYPERNDFLVINQFRADPPWATGESDFCVPDAVLFVNGIPLVVIECKSPAATDPLAEAIEQLLRYSNQREWVEEDEGVERLFHYNQIMVATWFYGARAAAVGAGAEQYVEWKDTAPAPMVQVAAELGVERLSSQQILVAGMLRPAHLLDIVRNFTLFKQDAGKTVKVVGRYQQFRAVHAAIRRLQHGQTRLQTGDQDGRGGIIWHTQGSGKSLTMVFLVRKLRTLPDLRRFKVVVVTDRQDLEKQLSQTAVLTGETVRKATSIEKLKELLAEPGADLVFAMIQKYQGQENALHVRDLEDEGRPEGSPRPFGSFGSEELFPVLNESSDILVMVDEAHRSHASMLHANLRRGLPNCAMIGSTGTPIIMGARKRTEEIFGPFIDRYTLQQSEADYMTVPILYEGRTADAQVADGRSLDVLFEDMFRERTPAELEAIKARYATTGNVLEAERLIAAKARDMLRHYVEIVLPEGFKAQVVAVSRRAAVRYQKALVAARDELVARLENLHPVLLALNPDELAYQGPETRFLVRARGHLETIRRLEFATVISGTHNDDPAWAQWSDRARVDATIERFKKPLFEKPGFSKKPGFCDGLAFLCVKSMLLTGFDAPQEQVLYLDRPIREHELLQAIARVNRTAPGKRHGLVVDYYGVGGHLVEALAAYSAEDVAGALISIRDLLPTLDDRHRRVLAVFGDRGISDISDVDACVQLLRDPKLRAEFVVKLKQFLETLNVVMPRPEALPYLRDAKLLGFIARAAANLYRDAAVNIAGVGHKVQKLIDDHILATGVDPKVPPISVLDADFERAVDAHTSDRARASEMEHAARYHISQHYREDPAYYKKLSQRLEEILQQFQDNWAALVEALRQFTAEVRAGQPADRSGLDPETQAPFLRVLAEEVGGGKELLSEQLERLAGVTVAMVDHIRSEIRMVDFWRNVHARNLLQAWLVGFLDEQDILPFNRLEAVADQLVELAKARHVRLTT